MNSRQIKYALLLSKTKNFSQLAEKLNISQPALSKQIQSLESELGVKLFDRSSTPLSLTPAGEYFISEAKELQYKEEQLVRTMERFKTNKVGRLTIGISPFRSQYLLPSILKQVNNKYPEIQIVLREAGSTELKKEVAEGKYDFAIVNLPVDDAVLDVIPLEKETLVLAVPNELVCKIPKQAIENNSLKFSSCKDIPFVTVGRTQELRILFDRLCTSSDIHPYICAEVVGITTARALVYAGIGASLLPYGFAKAYHQQNNTTLFALQDDIVLRQPVIVTRRGQYISECAKYTANLIRLCK